MTQLSAGEWLEIADTARELGSQVAGTRLNHWRDTLDALVCDAEREAGARSVTELRGECA